MRMKLVLTARTGTYDRAQGSSREYATSVVIDGKTQLAHATDRREPDGRRQVES